MQIDPHADAPDFRTTHKLMPSASSPNAATNRRVTPPVDYLPAAELRAALRRLTHATELITREHRLTARRYELLLFIQAADDLQAPATITSLREPLQTTQGSVTQLVAAAVKAGLVRRTTASLADRRSHHLHLTDEGMARLAAAHAALGAERDRLMVIVNGKLGPHKQ